MNELINAQSVACKEDIRRNENLTVLENLDAKIRELEIQLDAINEIKRQFLETGFTDLTIREIQIALHTY
jgi:hypothetical protein